MNSSYLSSSCLTFSSRRTWRVVVFGCFDGAFRSAKCFSPFPFPRLIARCITSCLLRLLHAAKTLSRDEREGRERPQRILGGRRPSRMGSLPPDPDVLAACRFASLFLTSRYFSVVSLGCAPKSEPKGG